jgi:3-phenylpropionate/trans-cinnamate dioxygenase ferredoxin subunit
MSADGRNGSETISQFVEVCDLDRLAEGKPLAVMAGGKPIAVVKQGPEVYAIEDVCSHAEVPLSEGEVGPGPHISCWLHGSEFDLRTGEPDAPPAFEPVAVYETQIEVRDGKQVVCVGI